MYCPRCGAIVEDGAQACQACGARIAVVEEAPRSAAPRRSGGGSASGISTWLVPNIIMTLFCCLPAGIVGIVRSAQAKSAINAGNYALAREKAESAKKAFSWGIVLFIVALVIKIILVILAAVAPQSGVTPN